MMSFKPSRIRLQLLHQVIICVVNGIVSSVVCPGLHLQISTVSQLRTLYDLRLKLVLYPYMFQ